MRESLSRVFMAVWPRFDKEEEVKKNTSKKIFPLPLLSLLAAYKDEIIFGAGVSFVRFSRSTSYFNRKRRTLKEMFKSLRCCCLHFKNSHKKPPDPIKLKFVLVGDGYCGKTSLQVAFRKDEFDDSEGDDEDGAGFDPTYRPTIFEAYDTDIQLDEQSLFQLSIWDTPGQEDYERLRPLSYPNANAIVLCFAVDSPDSLDNIEDKWIKELEYFCPKVPFVLVGKLPRSFNKRTLYISLIRVISANKVDLRQDQQTIDALKNINSGPVKRCDGEAVCQRIGAVEYLECSAKTKRGVREVFEAAARAAIKHKRRKKSVFPFTKPFNRY